MTNLNQIFIRPIFTAFFLLFVSFSVSAQTKKDISSEAKIYLENALDIMQKNSLLKKEIDWETIRRETFEKAGNAQETIETWDAIRFALKSLGDNHSFLQLNKELTEKENKRRSTETLNEKKTEAKLPSPYAVRRNFEGMLHKSGNCVIPRIVVPLYSLQKGDDFATKINQFIAEADTQNPCGWIIDLRGNLGGNVFPMLAGIGALLDEGNVSYSLDADGGKTFYFYKNGQSGLIEPDGKEIFVTKIGGAAYKIKKRVPIAVLIDKGTASSGEGIAIAFRGKSDTRFFGTHTYGVSTANDGFLLSDGANIVLTVGVGADKNGKIYMHGIEPDEVIPNGEKEFSANEDPVIHAALGWIGEKLSQ